MILDNLPPWKGHCESDGSAGSMYGEGYGWGFSYAAGDSDCTGFGSGILDQDDEDDT